tara:strand:+ start:988 stop:2955 length:1968 start_codon:yes stop_codon:yes gene_type:complete
MCGIVGFLNFTGINDPKKTIIAMSKAISYRGPDSSGFFIDNQINLALGHRRLSILDLSEDGSQPMSSDNGRFTLVYNGEIYNYVELKELLIKNNFFSKWKGNSDTEVLLECISHFGLSKTLQLIKGMFAFVLYDKKEKKIYLVRDRLGEKPLYYGWSHNSFLFASELKAFLSFPKFQKNISKNSLNLFFKHCYIPSSHCIYENIYKLQPSTYIEININKFILNNSYSSKKNYLNISKYWKPNIEKLSSDISKNEILDKIEYKLNNSVKQQMRSDVPIGSFLSGGIDSSLISFLMQKNSISKINTFNVSFNEAKFDESPYAKKVSEVIGSHHHEIKLNPKRAIEVIPDLGNIFDEPFADSSQIPTYLISKEIKKNVTVALSGDGGDELFGGYNRYVGINQIYKLSKFLPQNLNKLFSKLIFSLSEKNWDYLYSIFIRLFLKKYSYSNFGNKIFRLGYRLENCDNKIDIYKSFLSENYLNEEIVLGAKDTDVIEDIINDEKLSDTDFTNFMMLLDSKMYLPDDILVKVDRSSMANSLETRAPFLDYELVEYSQSIHSNIKIIKNEKKILLKEILNKYFNKNLFDRPKAGFAIPLAEWLRGPLKSLLLDSINSLKVSNKEILNFKCIDQKCIEHLKNQRNWSSFLWSVIIYNNWYQNN